MIRPSKGTGWRDYGSDLGKKSTGLFLRKGLDRCADDLPGEANQIFPKQVRRQLEVRAAFGELRRMLSRSCGPSFEARKSAHLRMTACSLQSASPLSFSRIINTR